MKFTTAVSLALAGTNSLVSCQPALFKAPALTGVDQEVVDAIQQAKEYLFQKTGLNMTKLEARGLSMLNEIADESHLSARAPQPGSLRELHARINSGDFDVNKAFLDAAGHIENTADSIDYNKIAKQGYELLAKTVKENDFNAIVQRWVENQADNAVNASLRKRGLISNLFGSLFNSGTIKAIIKTGAKVGIAMARNINFNSLANTLLDFADRFISGTDMNKAAAVSTQTAGAVVRRYDLNDLAARSLDVLLN